MLVTGTKQRIGTASRGLDVVFHRSDDRGLILRGGFTAEARIDDEHRVHISSLQGSKYLREGQYTQRQDLTYNLGGELDDDRVFGQLVSELIAASPPRMDDGYEQPVPSDWQPVG